MKPQNLFLATCIFFSLCSLYTIAQNNTLSKKEQKGGWKLLFDGKTTTGWRNFNSNTLGAGWKVADGTLYLDNTVTVKEDRGDIMTAEAYENYELSLEWKIDSCGNSGVIFNVVEDPKYQATYFTGPEMQVLDNVCHKDAKIEKHRAGDLYDLIKVRKENVKPARQWNHAKIVSNKARYEFWLNGEKQVEFIMHTPEWDSMVAASKFKSMPDFGKATKGHIALQDHGDKVWFRNIKIREIK
jgi:cytochrome c